MRCNSIDKKKVRRSEESFVTRLFSQFKEEKKINFDKKRETIK